MPAIHQGPAVLLKALLFAVLITFAIDSFVRRQVVGPFYCYYLIFAFKFCFPKGDHTNIAT